MKKKVVIVNDELGTIALGFSKAGYDIGAIYIDFSDAYNRKVCEENWNTVVKDISIIDEDDSVKEFSTDIDCIAGRINISFSVAGQNKKRKENVIDPCGQVIYMIQQVKPKCIIFQCQKMSKKNEFYSWLVDELKNSGYWIREEVIETGIITGFPIKEREHFLIGALHEKNLNIEILKTIDNPHYDIEEFLEKDSDVDTWYYNIKKEGLDDIENITKNSVLCWDGTKYKSDVFVKRNYMKIPLIYCNGNIRKITHREIARLKGIPDEYALKNTSKSKFYYRLMRCSNVQLIQGLAYTISFDEGEGFFRKREASVALQFEKILFSFFEQKGIISGSNVKVNNTYVDMQYKTINHTYNFEFKIYSNNVGVKNKIVAACKKISLQQINDQISNILVVGNIIEEEVKGFVHEQFNVKIWDIENILWLLEDLPQLKSEFIALLSFNISSVVPKKPLPDILGHLTKNVTKIDLQERLRKVKAGRNDAIKYEEVCIDIIKFLFSDNIQFYREQRQSNAGLYRLDFCGKIKHGNISEFFETIQRFFDTKYIIFEFKNYEEEITQKEIYTTEKYLYEKALRKVAIIISRKGNDENAKKAARGSLREQGKLILCLSDKDVNRLIDMKINNEDPTDYLEALLDEMLMDLEK